VVGYISPRGTRLRSNSEFPTQSHRSSRFRRSVQGGSQFGYGDTELGGKHRFVRETVRLPQMAVYPSVDLPTGDAARGLGAGHAQVFLPLWLQKSLGPWTIDGGSYWFNPGSGNRNWWSAGWLVQRTDAKRWA
jgi:hypothetical protein